MQPLTAKDPELRKMSGTCPNGTFGTEQVKDVLYRPAAYRQTMGEQPYERLQQARKGAGYSGPADAAKAFGWNENTYKSHENGLRGLRPKTAQRYARAFHVQASWLLVGGDTKGAAQLTSKELELLDEFRTLPQDGQEIVRALCKALFDRIVPSDKEKSSPKRRSQAA